MNFQQTQELALNPKQSMEKSSIHAEKRIFRDHEDFGELEVIRENEFEDELEKNSWNAPELNTMELCAKLIADLNGQGTEIDQFNLYLDAQSALDWEAVSNNEAYLTAQKDIPIEDAVKAIEEEIENRDYLDQNSLDIIALGPGNGHTEVALIKKLLRQTKISRIRLYLVDISQPLLNSAGNYARKMLRGEGKNVIITDCRGDFYHLSQYQDLVNISRRAKRMTLLTMFGYTFGNLRNERTFLKTSLTHFPKDTLLLIDVVLAFANADNEEEIKKHEPWLNGDSRWQEVIEKWVLGPIRRYRKGLHETEEIKFRAQLDESRKIIPGSYCVEILATLPDETTFSILYFKRYHANSLIKTMSQDGWETVDGWHFGNNNQLLHLFRKKS